MASFLGSASVREESPPIPLDPFGFVPSHASRIHGLGGTQARTDPAYAFHTPYAYCGEGEVTFELQFSGLVATRGKLTLRVHAYDDTPDAKVIVVEKRQVALRELARTGQAVSLRVTAQPHMIYAVVGSIHDETDAHADALAANLRRGGDDSYFANQLAAARQTVFETPSTAAATGLIVDRPATLADPLSQMCTMAQFEEPAYAEWVAAMQVLPTTHRKQWEFVYILQTLRHHGLLQPGSRGLGFGCGQEPLPAVMAAMGCTLVATDLAADDSRSADWNMTNQHSASIDALRYPGICPDALFDERVSFRPADMTQIPADLTGFDFTWSSCAYEHLGSIEAGLRFFEDSLACLRPGGIAVHTTEFNLISNTTTLDSGGTVLFRRRDFEELAVRLTERGHSVVPITYDAGDRPPDAHVDAPPYASSVHLKMALRKYVTTSFGMIVRRGPA